MGIEEHKVQIKRTGVYYTTGEENPGKSWFCCHGYGQLADRMIQKFDRRADAGDKIVCVEAPNRFYWKGVRGNAVSTWMTSRYRQDEIRDNNAYLTDVYKTEFNASSQRVLFGFSQGGTTLWRWIHDHKPDFEVFINYAGWIPEDIDLSILQEYLADKTLVFVYGSQDEYLTEDRIDALNMVIDRSGLDIQIVKTHGNHSIDRHVIDNLVATHC